MWLMIADEADQGGGKDFLIFGGVFFPFSELQNLHYGVVRLRKKYGFADGDQLKSSPTTRPSQIKPEDHAKIKNEILDLAHEKGCKICCYAILHDIAQGESHENKLKFGTNTLLGKFNQFLKENLANGGVAFFDHSEDYNQDNFLRESFQLGGKVEEERYHYDRIVSISSVKNGQSHLCSITDIVVGSFRFVANEPDKDKVGKILTKSLTRMMWGEPLKGKNNARDRGLCIRPQEIRAPKYRQKIDDFVDRLMHYAKD